jgi:hypothetical protein
LGKSTRLPGDDAHGHEGAAVHAIVPRVRRVRIRRYLGRQVDDRAAEVRRLLARPLGNRDASGDRALRGERSGHGDRRSRDERHGTEPTNEEATMLRPVFAHEHPKGTPMRTRWSSIAGMLLAMGVASGGALGVTPVTPLGAQTAPTGAPTAAQLDSIRQRLEDAEAALQALREQLGTEASTALRTRSRVSLEFSPPSDVFTNDAHQQRRRAHLLRPQGVGEQGGLAMSIRQTRLGLAFTVNEVAGGTFVGDLDADFFGGQQPSGGGRTFPLVRLRTARGAIEWSKGFVMIGQEQPLMFNLDPVSLASVGTPGFAGSGNLWLWLPQVRGGVHTTGRVRFGLEAAVLAPTSGDANGLFDTQFDPAERSRTPYLQGQARVDWGSPEHPGLVSVGYHTGRVTNEPDTTRTSWAVGGMVRVPLGSKLGFRGEYFYGEVLRGLGGGGSPRHRSDGRAGTRAVAGVS